MVRLRPATPSDIPLLEHWDHQPHVREATGDDDIIDWHSELQLDPSSSVTLIGEVDGRPVGVLQIIDPAVEPTHYWGDVPQNLRAIDIWLGDTADIGHGYGTEMMRLALERCFAPPEVTAVLIDPLLRNTKAHRFYQRLGFVPVEERWFGDDETLVHRLDRATWEAAG